MKAADIGYCLKDKGPLTCFPPIDSAVILRYFILVQKPKYLGCSTHLQMSAAGFSIVPNPSIYIIDEILVEYNIESSQEYFIIQNSYNELNLIYFISFHQCLYLLSMLT